MVFMTTRERVLVALGLLYGIGSGKVTSSSRMECGVWTLNLILKSWGAIFFDVFVLLQSLLTGLCAITDNGGLPQVSLSELDINGKRSASGYLIDELRTVGSRDRQGWNRFQGSLQLL